MSIPGLRTLLPNLISLARLLAVPIAVYVILQGEYALAFWIFVAAGVSDAVDGFLAKRLDAVTEIGTYLDPLADKVLLVGVYVALNRMDHIATWLVFLVVFRDFLIIGGAILYHTLTQSLKMDPLFISKVNTVTQITFAGVVLGELGLEVRISFLSEVLGYIVALTTFVSGAAYVYKWGRLAVSMERER